MHPYTRALLAAVPYPDPARRLDFAALMDGRASIPAAWPPPFDEDGVGSPRLFDLGGGHFVRRARAAARRRWACRHERETGRRMALAAHRCALWSLTGALAGAASASSRPPALAAAVRPGLLPPVGERLPAEPSMVALDGPGQSPGQYGGELRMLVSQPKDTRMMVVYGYARLVGYDPQLELVPDLLAGVDVEEGRIFTLHLRRGHRWSDGAAVHRRGFPFLLGGHRQQRVTSRRAGRSASCWSTASRRGSRCSTRRRCATPGRSPTRSSCRRWPGRGRTTSIARRTT